MRIRIQRIMTTLTTLLLLTAGTTSPSVFADSSASTPSSSSALDFSSAPLRASSVNPFISTYFFDRAAPGTTTSEALEITNHSSTSEVVTLFPVEATNGVNGNIDYLNTPSSRTWLTGLPSRVQLPPYSNKIVQFQIRVPKDAEAGDHVFAIALYDHPPKKMGSGKGNKYSFQVTEQVNEKIAVQIQVPGVTYGRIVFHTASMQAEPSGAFLRVEGVNEGNILLTGLSGTLTLSKDGRQVWATSISNLHVLPRLPFALEYHWSDGAPPEGNYTASVNLSGPNLQSVKQDISFGINVGKLQQLQQLTGQKTVQGYIPPWFYYAGGGTILIIAGLVVALFRLLKKVNNKA